MTEEQQHEAENTDPPENDGPDPDTEAKAREMGWKPQADWDDSRPGEWMPADEFVARQERLRNKADGALKAQLARMEKQLHETQDTNKRLVKMTEKVSEQAYERAKKEIEARQDKAVEEGDTQAYRQAKAEMDDLEKRKQDEAKTEPKAYNPDEDPDFLAWRAENDWYGDTEDADHIEMTVYANQIAPVIGAKHPKGGPEFYEAISKAVEKKFGKTDRRSQPAAVEAGGQTASKTKKGKGWSDLPAEAQQAGEKFIAQGAYEDTAKGRAEYAKEFFAALEE